MNKTLTLLAALFAVGAFCSVQSRTNVNPGYACGSDCRWTLSEEGVLLITGSGEMEDYPPPAVPWGGMKDSVKTVEISGVSSIGDYAFYQFPHLTNVTISSSVTKIGASAFRLSQELGTIFIPHSVNEIGDSAFLSCSSLHSIVVSSENEDYASDESGVLYDKNMSVLIQFPAGRNVTSFTVPATVTEIHSYAFAAAAPDYLTSIKMGNNVFSIGEGAFMGCLSLTSVELSNSLTKLSASTFWGCVSLTSIVIPDSVFAIGSSAFLGCESLSSVLIPEAVKVLENSTFYGCKSLVAVVLPASLSVI